MLKWLDAVFRLIIHQLTVTVSHAVPRRIPYHNFQHSFWHKPPFRLSSGNYLKRCLDWATWLPHRHNIRLNSHLLLRLRRPAVCRGQWNQAVLRQWCRVY